MVDLYDDPDFGIKIFLHIRITYVPARAVTVIYLRVIRNLHNMDEMKKLRLLAEYISSDSGGQIAPVSMLALFFVLV